MQGAPPSRLRRRGADLGAPAAAVDSRRRAWGDHVVVSFLMDAETHVASGRGSLADLAEVKAHRELPSIMRCLSTAASFPPQNVRVSTLPWLRPCGCATPRRGLLIIGWCMGSACDHPAAPSSCSTRRPGTPPPHRRRTAAHCCRLVGCVGGHAPGAVPVRALVLQVVRLGALPVGRCRASR